jgi:hypothetical protein
MTGSDLSNLRRMLDAIVANQGLQPHATRLALVTAALSEAFRRSECRATLVGGGAVEFYVPGVFTTDDIDLVIEGVGRLPDRPLLDAVFSALGFHKMPDRHWSRDDLFVDVPGMLIEDPVEETQVGAYRLRVVTREALIVGRILEYDQTGSLPRAKQAILLLQRLEDRIDRRALMTLLRRERAAKAYVVLHRLAQQSELAITDDALIEAREQLHRHLPQSRRTGQSAAVKKKPIRRRGPSQE